MLTRRQTLLAAAATFVVGAAGFDPAHAADKVVKIGIDLSLTGANSQGANRVKNGIVMAFDEANQGQRRPRLHVRVAGHGRRHGDRRPVRSGAGRDQRPQDGGRQGRGRRDRPADERRRQGDDADPEPGRPGDDHAVVHQSRHHQPEIRRAVSSGGQADLLPHRDDRRLPGPQHGELPGREAEGEVGVRAGRQRRVRRRRGGFVPEAGRGQGYEGARSRPAGSEGGRLHARSSPRSSR